MFSKADIHVHTDFSDGLHEPEAIINYAVTQTDLDVIAITDHNTVDGAHHAYDYWQRHRSEFRHIEVIRGVEVSSSKGHILGLFVDEDIPAHMSPADTVRAIHEQGGLAIAAHPFTHLMKWNDLVGVGREIGELPFDGVEVRNSVPLEVYSNWMTAAYNRRYRNHPELGGSDTHYMTMMGKTFTTFAGKTAEDFCQSLRRGKVEPGGMVNGPMLAFQVGQHLIRRRQLPVFLPDDHTYRHANAGLTVEVHELRDAPVAVLRCSGQLVRANAELLKNESYRQLDGGIPGIIIDMSELSFVDSAGLGVLVAIQNRIRSRAEGDIILCAPSSPVLLSMRLLRLDKVFAIHDTSRTAIEALRKQKNDS